jgi:hypothetical protein
MMHKHDAVHELKVIESEHDRVCKNEDTRGGVNCVKEEEDAVSNLNASCFASINNFVEFFKTATY